MPEIPTAPDVARTVADALEQAGVAYAVGGAIAYGYHGPPRATNDVDMTLFVKDQSLPRALDVLTAAGVDLDPAATLRECLESGASRGWFDRMRVDIFVPSIPFYEAAEERVVTVRLLGRPIRVLSAEDITVFKMLFFRAKDLTDVARLVAFQGENLDVGYVRNWLVETVGADDERVARWDEMMKTRPPA